jgi:hypothetical protein
MRGCTNWKWACAWLAIAAGSLFQVVRAGESRFAATNSRSQYAHWIDLYDESDHRIDPTDPNAPPYSPLRTCGRCHDYDAISHGYHFNAIDKNSEKGRSGEPWIWVDPRTGTQIPLSYRGWTDTFDPRKLGISEWEMVLQFGRHMPGGGPGEVGTPAEGAAGEAAKAPARPASRSARKSSAQAARWNVAGPLHVDCMVCHSANMSFSLEAWRDQIAKKNFAWASTAALGIGTIQGDVAELPEGFDPSKPVEGDGPKLPKTTYSAGLLNGEKKFFIDIVRTPNNNACYNCHTTRLVGKSAGPDWTHDQDIHLRAGMKCSDCHRNGIDHQTVRGYEGEKHPTGVSIATLSCRGCHLGEGSGDDLNVQGRFGAPKPLHKGLPPLHLDKLSCTACHSGPRISAEAVQVQTAMAHGLGLPSHEYSAESAPGIVEPVLMPDDQGKLYPHRMVWPAYWGTMKDFKVKPLHPEAVNEALRRAIRVRRGSTFAETMAEVKLTAADKAKALGEARSRTPDSELTEQEKAKLAEFSKGLAAEALSKKLAEALKALKTTVKEPGAEPVYIAGGKLYHLVKEGEVEITEPPAAKPYAWKLGHDVRPARSSLGATSCFDCHAIGSPIFESKVTAISPVPDNKPATRAMHQLEGLDKLRLDAWSQSFQGRASFKYFALAAMSVVALIMLSYSMKGIHGIIEWGRRG